MVGLRFFLFGTFRVMRGDHSVEVRMTRKVQELLGFLLLHRDRRHAREVLGGLFWGELSEERARSCLNTAVWRLRRILEGDDVARGTYIKTYLNGDIGLGQPDRYWLDVAEFERTGTHFLSIPTHHVTAGDVERVEAVLRLHVADLMEGFFDEWAVAERERLRSLHGNVLTHLMRVHRAQGAFDAGLRCGQQILQLDPFREEAHREMMSLYLLSGQRARAALQYEHCRRILHAQLGIPPMKETRELYAQIVPTDGRTTSVEPGAPEGGSGTRPLVVEAVRLAAQLHDAGVQLQEASATLRRLECLLVAQGALLEKIDG